ncbi:MAG TPA: ABC transporter permease [Verrucomicrobiae bacterium]|nr:ABC transporter permease [Verrucomicrobiae bacterium]
MTILDDVRYALRVLRKSPAYTVTAVAALALGIGANTAIFSVFNALLLHSLPYGDPQSLVAVWEDAVALGFPRDTPSAGSFQDWKTQVPAFQDVAAADTYDATITGDGEPEKVGAAYVTYNLFTVAGVSPLAGRLFRPEEDVAGARVVILSYGLWLRRFNGDRSVVGRDMHFNGANYTIAGVMPPRFQYPFREVELWTPAGFTAEQLANRDNHYLDVIARLKPGVSLAQANQQLRALAARRQQEFPKTNGRTGMYAVSILDDYLGSTRLAIDILFAAVAGVLLIACANLANLALTRASSRRREIAVRTALGAARARIVRQLVTENLVVAAAGGLLGLGLARAAFAALRDLIPQQMGAITGLTLDGRVLAFTLAVSVLTGLLFGLAPAWRASRTDLTTSLKDGGGRGTLGGGRSLRGLLVAGQIAASMVLLIGAGLMIESFSKLRGVDVGFRTDGVFTVNTSLSRTRYRDPLRRTQFVEQVLERVRRLPGVDAAGYTSALPLVWKGGTSGFWPEGRAAGDDRPHDANNRVISPGYMETMGYRLRAGRMFDERDTADAPPVAMINETMARQNWPHEDAVGKRFKWCCAENKGPWFTIVGVVGDIRMMGLDQPSRAEMYYPVAQAAKNWMWPQRLVVRTGGNRGALVNSIRQAVWQVDREQPVSDILTMDEIVGDETTERRTQTLLLGAFSGLALLLACLGIYAVLSYQVAQRTPEIGLRMALGARKSEVLRWIGGRAMALTLAGVVCGLASAWWATGLLQSLLFQIRPRDPLTFAAAALAVMTVSVIAVAVPVRRAVRVDPAIALRHE